MRTLAQIEVSRRNGAKPHGPATPEHTQQTLIDVQDGAAQDIPDHAHDRHNLEKLRRQRPKKEPDPAFEPETSPEPEVSL